jgi:outer membrane protein assembly factor BamA
VGTTAESSKLEKESIARVGQIFVVGNSHTPMNVILRQLAFAGICPGQILTYPDLRIAERNLARLGIFKRTPDGSVKPTVIAVDNPKYPNSEYKDIIVMVEEKESLSCFQMCCDSLDRWSFLLDIRLRVIIPWSLANYVYNRYCR